MSAADALRAEAAKRILIKDGAYGTLIQARRLQSDDYRGGLDLVKDQRGNNDLLNLTRPELIEEIADRFRRGRAPTSSRPTPSTPTRISQADYGAEDLVARHQPRRGADRPRGRRPLRSADGKPRWVAGALGPTNKTLSLSPDVNDPAYREVDFDTMKAVYREQVDALVEGGVDFILIETIFDTLNAKAGIMAALEAEAALGRPLPLMISMTLTDLERPQPVGPHGRGLLGVGAPRPAGDHRAQLLVRRGAASAAPRGAGGHRPTRWSWPIPTPACPTSSANMTRRRRRPRRRSPNGSRDGLVNIVGGCCGTTAEHIAAIAGAARGGTPRQVPGSDATPCSPGSSR